jgi:hypothetical protein
MSKSTPNNEPNGKAAQGRPQSPWQGPFPQARQAREIVVDLPPRTTAVYRMDM